MNIETVFPQRLRELLDEHNMTVTELGAQINVSKQTISKYVNGLCSPKRPNIAAIAKVFGVNPVWLMGYDTDKYTIEDNSRSFPIAITNTGNNNAIAAGENCSATVAAEYTPQERELIETFRGLSLADQSKALNYIFRMAKK